MAKKPVKKNPTGVGAAPNGVSSVPPPGTAYISRPASSANSRNSKLAPGIAIAYNAAGQPIGVVSSAINEGVAVTYADGKPTGFQYAGPTGQLQGPMDQNGDGVVDPRPAAGAATDPAAEKAARPAFNGSTQDGAFLMAEAQRQNALAAMLEGARGGEASTGLDYGFGFGRYATDVKDASGRVIHRANEVNQSSYTQPTSFTSGDTVGGYGNTDPNNPFSRASMLQKSYANANNVSSGSFANRGQLSSGAYQRQQGRNTFGYDQGKDSLMKSFAQRMAEFQGQRSTAYSTNDTAQLQNSNDLFQRNLAAYNASYPSG
jgi:hypothetical protein